MQNRYAFVGGSSGQWRVLSISAQRGPALDAVETIDVQPYATDGELQPHAWALVGQVSHLRYATRTEVTTLRSTQESLGRSQARRAALIPMKKSDAWWTLAQDERRAIFEEQSHHTAIGLGYLPAIARQLYHSRDLGQPFDFLTWFEYAPEHADAFEELVGRLRATREWQFVEREVDIRLERHVAAAASARIAHG
jgi:chlorite dismutase